MCSQGSGLKSELLFSLLLLVFSCDNNSFKDTASQDAVVTENNGNSDATDTAGIPQVEDDNGIPIACFAGDVVQLKFPEDIESCFAQKHIWDFARQQCLTNIITSRDCSFDFVKGKLENLGISTGTVDNVSQSAKLVACGEKNQNQVVFAQWVYINQIPNNCQYNPGELSVVTACYKNYSAEEAPNNNNTPDEIRAIVQSCLDE